MHTLLIPKIGITKIALKHYFAYPNSYSVIYFYTPQIQ